MESTPESLVPFTWNLVTRNLIGHPLLRKQLSRRVTALGKLLRHYPPDGVHLHVLLEKNPHRDIFMASLTLRLPRHILHSEKTAREPILALDKAFAALEREVEKLKAEQRGEPEWKRQERRQRLKSLKSTGFAPEPLAEGEGPQDQFAVVVDFLKRHYLRMLEHVRRHVRHDEWSGELPPHAVDPRGVVDEVVRKILRDWQRKPKDIGWLVWFFRLLHRELERRRRELREAAEERVPIDAEARRPDEEDLTAGFDAEQPLDIIVREYEPVLTELRELVPDPNTSSPEDLIERRELLEGLQKTVQQWPRLEKDVFELYFVQGFDEIEVAEILRIDPQKVRETVAGIQARIRQTLVGAS